MLTDGNAVTLQSMPHTEGYSDYFSQSGTHLSCSFLDKLPNPERKKTYMHPGQGQRGGKFSKITGRCFLTVRAKGMRSKDHGKQTAPSIIWNNIENTTFSLNSKSCIQTDL